MCGRFALVTEKRILDMLYDLEIRTNFELPPRYNIAPSQEVPAVRNIPGTDKRELILLKWGLIPFWSKEAKSGSGIINARAETVATKPSFREAFKKRRALIPASGFYEWKKEIGGKQPYFIKPREGDLISLAGIWERWESGSEVLETFAILTTEPNSLLSGLHDRMPVIIPRGSYQAWLAPETELDILHSLMIPYPSDKLSLHPVAKLVNSPASDGPELIEPESHSG